jgi:hypothetical protein
VILKAAPGVWQDEGLDLEILIALGVAFAFAFAKYRSSGSRSACLSGLGCLVTLALAYLLVSVVPIYWGGRTLSFEVISLLALGTVAFTSYRLLIVDKKSKTLGSSAQGGIEEGRGQGPAPSD